MLVLQQTLEKYPSRKKLLAALRNLLLIDTDKPFYYTIATEVVFFHVASNKSTDGHRLRCCICLKNLMTRRRSQNCKLVEFSVNPLGKTTISTFKCLIHLNHFDFIINWSSFTTTDFFRSQFFVLCSYLFVEINFMFIFKPNFMI